jgi:fumarate hydratase class II
MTDANRLDELETRLNAAEAALTDVVKIFRTHKMRVPPALLAWYSQHLPPEAPQP